MYEDEDEAVKAAEQERKRFREEMAFVMGAELGRRFVARVAVSMCGSDVSTFSPDAAYSAYAQGRRDLGNELKQQARDFDLGLYMKMMEEFYGR